MGATLNGVDVVRKGENQLVVAVVILHRHLGDRISFLRGEMNDIGMQRFKAALLMQVIDKARDAALVAEIRLKRLSAVGAAGVTQNNPQAGIEKRLLPQTQQQHIAVKFDRLKNLSVGLKGNGGAGVAAFAGHLEVGSDLSALEALMMAMASIPNLHLKPFGKGVDRRGADSMQAARNLVTASAELSARVQDGQNHCNGRNSHLWMKADRDAAPIVPDTDDIPRQDIDLNIGAITCKGLIDRIIDDLVNKVVQAARTG